MVDGISDEERERFALKVKAGFVLLVGLSGGLITLYAGVGWRGFLVATAIGLVFGAALVWWVFPERADLERGDRSRSRRGRR
jgi:uncharacterized membrane protein YccC